MVDRVDEAPKGRVAKLLERFRQAEQQEAPPPADPMKAAAAAIQKVSERNSWTVANVKSIYNAIMSALHHAQEQAARLDAKNDLAIHQAVESTRSLYRQMLETTNPPPEIIESPEHAELRELLKPHGAKQDQSSFERGSAMKGKAKQDAMARQISEAIDRVSKEASQRIKAKLDMSNPAMAQFAQMSLAHMARQLKRILKKRKGQKVDENGELLPENPLDDVELRELMDLFCGKALETMKLLRDEVAPKWAPEQQPWLMQEADKQVYDILLAVIPEELFKETEAWQEIQDLRAGQAVFTLRAADKLIEGARRK
jgi:hypothetical protein